MVQICRVLRPPEEQVAPSHLERKPSRSPAFPVASLTRAPQDFAYFLTVKSGKVKAKSLNGYSSAMKFVCAVEGVSFVPDETALKNLFKGAKRDEPESLEPREPRAPRAFLL